MASFVLRARGWGPHTSPCTSTCLPEVQPQTWRTGLEAPMFALPSSLCLLRRTFFSCSLVLSLPLLCLTYPALDVSSPPFPGTLSLLLGPWLGPDWLLCFKPLFTTVLFSSLILQTLQTLLLYLLLQIPFFSLNFDYINEKKKGGTWCVIECFSFILLKCQYRRIKYWTVCLWHLSQLACLSCFVSVSLQSPFFISPLKMLQGS